jgi:hypothetical protein
MASVGFRGVSKSTTPSDVMIAELFETRFSVIEKTVSLNLSIMLHSYASL